MVGFVPSYLLPKKRPISLDPFLEPLMQDIEEGFINGLFCLAYVYFAQMIVKLSFHDQFDLLIIFVSISLQITHVHCAEKG